MVCGIGVSASILALTYWSLSAVHQCPARMDLELWEVKSEKLSASILALTSWSLSSQYTRKYPGCLCICRPYQGCFTLSVYPGSNDHDDDHDDYDDHADHDDHDDHGADQSRVSAGQREGASPYRNIRVMHTFHILIIPSHISLRNEQWKEMDIALALKMSCEPLCKNILLVMTGNIDQCSPSISKGIIWYVVCVYTVNVILSKQVKPGGKVLYCE